MTIFKIMQKWIDLVEMVKNKYRYETGPLFDIDLFRKCMKETYEHFFIENEPKDLLSKDEAELLGWILSYSNLPIVHSFLDELDRETNDPIAFEASMMAASYLADSILDSTLYYMDDYKMGAFCDFGKKEFKVYYDFKSGDFGYYIKRVEEQYSE